MPKFCPTIVKVFGVRARLGVALLITGPLPGAICANAAPVHNNICIDSFRILTSVNWKSRFHRLWVFRSRFSRSKWCHRTRFCWSALNFFLASQNRHVRPTKPLRPAPLVLVRWSVPAAVAFNPNEEEAVALFLARPTVETYSAVFRLLAPRVQAYFRARGYDAAAAEDLSQEVMLVVYRESRRLREKGAFQPWLFKISRNVMLQDYRRATRRPQIVEITEMESSAGDPLAGLQFAQWMKCLNDDERETVMLRYVEGLEYHEIAEVLGIPIGTAQWRIFSSKKKLAASFGHGV
ncbi:MAG: hypothetical protein C5B51_15235 [Terriglobia bacterium]|nr:MAG: hypothetical protein C5B51_15235 [Terriglobia bacterium]